MPQDDINCCLNAHLHSAAWRQGNASFRDFQSIHINTNQTLLQETSTAGMGVGLKIVCWEDSRQLSLLLLCKTECGSESEVILHARCYSECLHSW